jgi:hypothetical protein
MAIKEKIRVQRDLDLKRINESDDLTHDEKVYLTGLVTDAAECTNGYEEHQKVQNLSETTFGIVTLIIKLTEQLNQNNRLTVKLAESMTSLDEKITSLNEKYEKTEEYIHKNPKQKWGVENLDWKDTAKLILVKPWVWVCLAALSFSPKCIEMITILLNHFGH